MKTYSAFKTANDTISEATKLSNKELDRMNDLTMDVYQGKDKSWDDKTKKEYKTIVAKFNDSLGKWHPSKK